MQTISKFGFERRGTMIYQEGTGIKGSAKFIKEYSSVEIAQQAVERMNEIMFGDKSTETTQTMIGE